MEDVKFKRDIFRKCPSLNLIMTTIVTLLILGTAILDICRERYLSAFIFSLLFLAYLIFMIPLSYKLMKLTKANNKNLDDLEKRIKEARRKYNENISEL